ncbi:MAG: hypothetical protein E7812_02415 [Phenylobacterium sp.]|nr:MAG: hypothetical protein E7812_02415 [Phenylobacterium sp.]
MRHAAQGFASDARSRGDDPAGAKAGQPHARSAAHPGQARGTAPAPRAGARGTAGNAAGHSVAACPYVEADRRAPPGGAAPAPAGHL